MSSFLVIGAGLMGRAVALDLCRSPGVDSVLLTDMDADRVGSVLDSLRSPKASAQRLDVTDRAAVIEAMRGRTVAVSCVPYRHNAELARAAVKARCSICDLGGNNDVVAQELALDAEAKGAGMTIVPDCGLAPGLTNVLSADALARFDRLDELHIRVGGLPLRPRPPLGYQLVFNPSGLINEYKEMCLVIRDGEVRRVESMTGLEALEFPPPFGHLEAFNTSGGTSTLPLTLKGRVRELDYKTIRYPGHCERIRLLMDLGLFDERPVRVGGTEVLPRELIEALFVEHLSFGDDDAVLVRVTAKGARDGRERTLTHTIIDHCDRPNNLTAMMRTTAFPASIVAQMVADGTIARRGAVPQELVVPTGPFIEQLGARGIRVETAWD